MAGNDELPDAKELAARMAEIAERSNRIFRKFLERQDDEVFQIPDPKVVSSAFAEFAEHLMANPEQLIDAQLAYWKDMGQLWEGYMRRMLGEEVPPMATPSPDDRRFKDEAWSEDLVFDYIKQSYLVTASWIHNTVGNVEGLDPALRNKVAFFTRQYVDAMAPSNFARDQSGRAPPRRRDARREPLRGAAAPARRPRAAGGGRAPDRMTEGGAFVVGENIAPARAA
jgi:polyhydroxyalkanoate synthase